MAAQRAQSRSGWRVVPQESTNMGGRACAMGLDWRRRAPVADKRTSRGRGRRAPIPTQASIEACHGLVLLHVHCTRWLRRPRIPTPSPDVSAECMICKAGPVSGNAKSAKRNRYVLQLVRARAQRRRLRAHSRLPPSEFGLCLPLRGRTGIEGVAAVPKWAGSAL